MKNWKKLALVFGLLLMSSGCTSSKKKQMETLIAALEKTWSASSLKIETEHTLQLSIWQKEEEMTEVLKIVQQVQGERETVEEENWYHLALSGSFDDQDYELQTWLMEGTLYLIDEQGSDFLTIEETDYLSAVRENYGDFIVAVPALEDVESIKSENKEGRLRMTLTLSSAALKAMAEERQSVAEEALITAGTIFFVIDEEGYLCEAQIELNVEESDPSDPDFQYLSVLRDHYRYRDFDKTVIEELEGTQFMERLNSYPVSTHEELLSWLIKQEGYQLLEEGIYRQDYGDGEFYYFDFNAGKYIYEYDEKQFLVDWKTNIGTVGSCRYDLAAQSVLAGECSTSEISDLQYALQCLQYDLNGVIQDWSLLEPGTEENK